MQVGGGRGNDRREEGCVMCSWEGIISGGSWYVCTNTNNTGTPLDKVSISAYIPAATTTDSER